MAMKSRSCSKSQPLNLTFTLTVTLTLTLTLTKSRSKITALAADRGSPPAGKRLHQDGEARAELRERRALASEQWEVASFPFAPHINERPAGSTAPSRPLHERLEP